MLVKYIKNFWILVVCYIVLLVILTVFSYGLVDPNFPYKLPLFLYDLVYTQRPAAVMIYSTIIVLLFVIYGIFLYQIKKKELGSEKIWQLIGATSLILFISYPAFSNDIFNYIATAKVAYLYRENPYIVMPIEIPNEPMLKFLHAANKTALYGPSWILLTAIPHFVGLGSLILTIITFKAVALLFYLGLGFLLWKISNKSTFVLAFFALNPLVVIETLVSAHNDVVMMFFAILSLYMLQRKKYLLSTIYYLLSIFIKYSTIFLLPVYLYIMYLQLKNKKVDWTKIWIWSAISMYIIFLLAPLREELYSWYFIWPLTFVALVIVKARLSILYKALLYITLAFSFGLLFRFAPFIYTREWGGITPLTKTIATFLPPLLALFYLWLKNTYQSRLS